MIQHPQELEKLCAHLRALRGTYGYTQHHLAQALNISRSQYTALEMGRSMLTFDHLCGIANCYELELSALLLRKD